MAGSGHDTPRDAAMQHEMRKLKGMHLSRHVSETFLALSYH